jgi:Flp pilus assembly protein TadD
VELGQWQDAEAAIAPLANLESKRALALTLQADIERGKHNWPGAQLGYQQALSLEPQSLAAIAGITDSYLMAKNHSAAEAFLTAHSLKYPALEDFTREMLAKVYLMTGRKKEAIRTYQAVIEKSPTQIASVQKLASVLVEDNKIGEAETLLRKAISLNPQAVELSSSLALLLEDQARFAESKLLYEAVLARAPNHALARNHYAILLMAHFADQENLAKALELSSGLAIYNLADYQDTVGWAHYANGHYQEAIRYLHTAVNLAPQTDIFRYHLGMAYYKNGDIGEAKTALRLAVQGNATAYLGAQEARRVFNSI